MDFGQVLLVLVFSATIVVIAKEPRVSLFGRRVRLDYGIAPILALAALALMGFIDTGVISGSLLGTGGLIPWEIIVIFFTSAYICVSLDATGVLEYASFHILRLAGGRGRRLYFYLVGFAAFLTLFTSNDIVTLTMTPIICYMAKHARINPIPYLIAVFFASNTWSMVFYVGNPPNVVVAQAFNLGFIEYAGLMLMPTVVAGVSTTLLTYFISRKYIPRRISMPERISPGKYLRNKAGAAAGIVLFAAFFATLAASDYSGVRVWQVTALFSLMFLAMDTTFSFVQWRGSRLFFPHPYHHTKTRAIMHAHGFSFRTSELFMSLQRMPWKIFPLIVSFFIIVHLFALRGITGSIAAFLSGVPGIFGGTLMTALLSSFFANVMINQPMTILFANAMLDPAYLVTGAAKLSNGLALVIGANLGGNLTLFGALAGMMWSRIISYHGKEMTYTAFLRYSLKVIPLVIVITALALALQMSLI